MLVLRILAGSSLLALAAGTAVAQITTTGTNRSEVQDNGRDNKAQVENGAPENERNASLVVFNGNANRATVSQIGFDNSVATRQQGDSNASAVRQLGFRNSATILQAGSLNSSIVDQHLDPRIQIVGDRVAVVEQRGNSNASTVTQVHWNNRATVRQGTEAQASNGGVSTIYQFSAGNVANVTMTGGSPDLVNRSHVEQTRLDPIVTNSTANVSISGIFNLSYLFQLGANNNASHTMAGEQNVIIAKSYGGDHTTELQQEGYRNFITVNQFAGVNNTSRVNQRAGGGDRQASVTQGGSDHFSEVVQSLTGNVGLVNQSGSHTRTSLFQNAVDSVARITLLGGSVRVPNTSFIQQGRQDQIVDSGLSVDVTIRGFGNSNSVEQVGTRHAASIDLEGGSSGIANNANRSGHAVRILQTQARPDGSFGAMNGAGHFARVQARQGIDTSTSITQQGEHPTVGHQGFVWTSGSNTSVTLSQTIRGSQDAGGSRANISATGANSVRVAQIGDHNAIVTQGLGEGSTFSSTQYDSGGAPRTGTNGEGIRAFDPSAVYRGDNQIKAAQYGNRNSMDVFQSGSDDVATVWQLVGSAHNSIRVDQGSRRAGGAPAPMETGCPQVRCENASKVNASITQGGQFNSASVYQASASGPIDGSVANIEQRGTGSSTLRNIAQIEQYAERSKAEILQTADVGPSQAGDPASGLTGDPKFFAGGARSSEARIRQAGRLSTGRIEQRGRGQFAFINQEGAGNEASILQDLAATNATAMIVQTGSGNVYHVVQDKPGQYISVSQTGTNNAVTNVISRP